jgi:hypothetical protein
MSQRGVQVEGACLEVILWRVLRLSSPTAPKHACLTSVFGITPCLSTYLRGDPVSLSRLTT